MTAKYGLTLSRWATALLAIFALSLGGSSLAAQETSGKVEGTVRDPNDQPVAGAQVLIMGTSFSAQTNTGGYYFINNVPAGTYNVRAQFIGLQPAEIQNVRISAGQTVTVDYDLQGAIALEAIAITTAAQPIIPRDQVSSRAIVSGSDIDQLPLSDPNAIVTLQPGVVRARGGAISIRGGRVNEAAVFIDGAPVRNNRTASTRVNLSTNAIEEVAVTTGALSAEFGDAQSGVISFVTRSGGPSFAGTLAYESDEAFGDAISVGFNRFEASLSGPIIGNLTFFVGGTLQGHKSDFLGKGADEVAGYQLAGFSGQVTQARGLADSVTWDIPVFVQYQGQCDAASNLTASGTAVECQGRRRAGDWTTNARLSGKLQTTYGSGSSIALSAHVDRDQNMNTNPFLFESAFGSRSESNVYVLNWVQQLT
ncbi:MAG: carboxypeptidase regulatory-like domain-containing protein, partial [Gemmatimonadetes bacterium]|nr:carboxypeptidase regulatory-like domain-containing protein [Gemmatimonadota bacterium]